ncbi:hypothetical protein BCY84_19585 [Trypanosoma cruzi cruzi]|nr:hypothetical protein BCY84_19585 [Trypanosoma cruzi cruzi]
MKQEVPLSLLETRVEGGIAGMSAFFDFETIAYALLLVICTATYLRQYRPTLFHRDHNELYRKFLYKCSVIGDRLSLWVALGCFVIAMRMLFVY